MALADIRTAIKARVETIPDVGIVSDWEPYILRDEDIRTYFKATTLDYFQGWTITREHTEEEPKTMKWNYAKHTIVIRGYSAVNAAAFTEKRFQDLIELIRGQLRLEQRNKFGVPNVVAVESPQVRVVDPRLFVGILCHYCEIVVRVTEALEQYAPAITTRENVVVTNA
jgi:hypothetical protein